MSYIGKIRDRLNIRGGGRQESGPIFGSADLPLDHRLTFNRDANEEWSYRDGHIFVNGVDIDDVLEYEGKDVRLWCSVSEAISDYKDEVARRADHNVSKFIFKIDSLQDKVLGNMKRLYDEKMDGYYLTFGDGEMLLNNFNVRAFLALYHMRPTEKARKFLVGLKSKLALILVSKNCRQQQRVPGVLQQIYDEVLIALEISPIETRRLTADFGSKSL